MAWLAADQALCHLLGAKACQRPHQRRFPLMCFNSGQELSHFRGQD